MLSIFQPQTMPVDTWCYYRAFKMTAQGNDTVIFLIGLFSTTTTTTHPPHPPHGCCPSLLTFPECLPASETPSNTRWHLERRRRKEKKKIISVTDGTGTMKSFTLWPHLASSGGSGRSRGGGESWLCRCAAVLLKSVRGRFARLPYPPPPPSCKDCSFLS